MANEVKYKDKFYAGADYGLNPTYGAEFSTGLFPAYRFQTGNFGLPSDPRTANQLKAVSDKLNTGAKTIEVSGVQAATWETVPEHHLEEIYRLKKLVGTDLTFHGPLVEATGVTKQGWNESHRQQAERQMWQSVERAQKMDPKGNLVVTFHSSNGLPDPETTAMQEVVNSKTGKKEMKEVIKDFWLVTNDGQFQSKTPDIDYFRGKDGSVESLQDQRDTIQAAIEKQNKDQWFKLLQQTSFHAYAGDHSIRNVLSGEKLDSEFKGKTDEHQLLEMYKDYLKNGQVQEILGKVGSPYKDAVERQLQELAHGQIYLKDAYQDLQNLFNLAYKAAVKEKRNEDKEKLDMFRKELEPNLNNLDEPENLVRFGKVIVKGVNVLNSIKEPSTVTPLREFGIDKSSETFANIAFNSYDKFGEYAPIVSIENPPAGSGLSRARDLRDIVEKARGKLTERLVKEQKLSENEAKKQAEKLIGVTWDVGHINMLKKYGYSEDDIAKEAKTIGGMVNKIHLSDNFGMEHTELPMGMGNVDLKKQFAAIKQAGGNIEKLKQIVETGNWFGPQAFGNMTPFAQTLKSFGSPIYSMKMSPYWNQAFSGSGGYFSGYGQTLPDQHFSMYGAGFSGMPKELGGQQAGGRSRVGGTPID